MTTYFLVLTAFVGLVLSIVAVRALGREKPACELTWQREACWFGVVGGAMMAYVGYAMYDTVLFPVDVLLMAVGCIVVLMGLLSGFSATRLAFYLDNGRWPTDQRSR